MNPSVLKLLRMAAGPLGLKVGAAVFGLIFNYLAAHLLPLEEFGAFSAAMVVVLFLTAIVKMGLESTVVKLTAYALTKQYQSQVNGVWSLSLGLVLILSAIAAVFLFLADTLIAVTLLEKPDLVLLLPILIFIILPKALTSINSSVFKGFKMANLSVLFSGTFAIIITTVLTVIDQPSSARELLILTAIGSFASCIISTLIGVTRCKLRLSVENAHVDDLLSSCLPLWIASLVALIIQQFSVLVLAKFAPLEEVGIFAIALKVAALMSFALFAVNTVMAPRFAALYHQNKLAELRTLARFTNRVLLLVALVMGAAVFLTAEFVMGIFGAEFVSGALYLKILTLGYMVNLGTGSVVSLLVMTSKEKLHQNTTLLVAVVTVALALWLIPEYGAMGAAITTAAAMALQNLLSLYFVRKLIL